MLDVAEQIDIEHLCDYKEVLSEEKAAIDLEELVLIWLFVIDSFKNFSFDLSIFSLTLGILTDFDSDDASVFFHISAVQNFSEGARTAYFVNDVAVTELLAHPRDIRPIWLRKITALVGTDLPNRIYCFVLADLGHLKDGKFIVILL